MTKIINKLATLGLVSVSLIGCADKKKSKRTDDPNAGSQANYTATLVLPLSANEQLALTGSAVATVDVTRFDLAGNEIEKSEVPVSADSDGVPSAQISINPSEITVVEAPGEDLGIVMPATGKKPSDSVQRPLTASGKNVVKAFKELPAEDRPFVDPEAVATLLPAGMTFDPKVVKEMVKSVIAKVKEIPEEKRVDLFLKRLNQNTDYKAVAKVRGNLDTAQAAEAFQARKAFVEENPDMATRPLVKFLEKPSDAIENDPIFLAKIPEDLREKVSGEAVSRQILASRVSTSDRPLDPSELAEMTDALADVKAAVTISRRGDGVGSKDNMSTVIKNIVKRAGRAEQPADIRAGVLLTIVSTVPELIEKFEEKRIEVSDMMCTQVLVKMFNDTTQACHTARNGCEAAKLRQNGWRSQSPTDVCEQPSAVPEHPCTDEFVKMFHPRTANCQVSNNSCVTKNLKIFGWREKTGEDSCSISPGAEQLCLQVRSFWRPIADAGCTIALNSCEAQALERAGLEKTTADACDGSNLEPFSLPDDTSATMDCDSIVVNAPMVNRDTQICQVARTQCDERTLIADGYQRSLLTACP